ncbi:hypothetical protein BGX24_002075 [Mortierella sp. AD032]|nr:hypothetical protein BGX24_002075 [Mortierella sp. AD032]
MFPSPVYRPPVSNIAYHVYNPEDDLERVQAVSQRAFQRIMDSYNENERLADLFQIEHDKQQKLVRERKEREKLLKQQQKQKQSKRHHGYPSRSQDRIYTLPTPFERQSFRRFPKNISTPALPLTAGATPTTTTATMASTTAAAIAEKAEELRHQFAGSLKRARRLSDISNSDISGLGDDDVRSAPPTTSSQVQDSTTSGPAGLGIHLVDSNDRSISSSPALPITPPPRDSPSNMTSQAGQDGTDRSTNQAHSTGLSSLAASTTSSSSFAVPNPPQQELRLLPSGSSRRKRKQAIPVHPSVVERIPGITIRIQRERQGDQLEVEILKTLDDYAEPKSDNEETPSPSSKLQAKQDLRKVRESIDSGRPGYAYYSPAGSTSHTQQHIQRDSTTATSDYANRGLEWTKSLPGSLSSLTWTSSNTNSTENLTVMQDFIDARSMPLSWENFATRECVVNKIVGKHDKDLDTLEEVVQDAIARQQYALQLQQEQEEQERLRAQSLSPIESHRGLSVGFTGSENGINGTTTHPASSSRASKSVNGPSMRTRSIPARATRSKAQTSTRAGQLVVHEDIEHHLKQKRRRQREQKHRRQGSKTSSKDGEEDEDDDDEEDDEKRDSSRRTTHDGDESAGHTDDGDSDEDGRSDHPSKVPGAKRKYNKRSRVRRGRKDDDVPTSASSSDDERNGKGGRKQYHADDSRARSSTSSQKKTFKQAPHPDRNGSEPIRRNKKFWSRGRNSRKEDEVDDTATGASVSGSGSDGDEEGEHGEYEDVLNATKKAIRASIQTRLPDSWMRKSKGLSDALQNSTYKTLPRRAFRRPSAETTASEDSDADGGDDGTGNPGTPKNQAFAKTLNSSDKANFFNSAVELIHQKNLEMLESRRKGHSQAGTGAPRDVRIKALAELKEKQVERQKEEEKEKETERLKEQKEQEEQEERELEKEKELQESRVKMEVRLVEESKAQKVESTNLPRSSKSLPGRVLRRAAAGGSGGASGGEDPDCTSCRLELSPAEKDAWKLAQQKGEIRLPKTWGTHAILCVACRNQYLGHHSRCTACFYVPVEEEMETSGKRCSRCKAGTWLTEMVQRPPFVVSSAGTNDDKRDRRRRLASDLSM